MSSNARRLLLLSSVALAGYVVLVGLVGTGVLDHSDLSVRAAAAHHRQTDLLLAARYLTDVLSPLVDALVLGAGAAAIAWHRRRLWPLVAAVVTGWFMAVVVVLTKHATARPAPYPNGAGAPLSFPSGHTASALVCLGTLALLSGLWRPSAVRPALTGVAFLTAVVAAALVYHGYHWLWDCVASVLLGVGLLALLQWWLSRRRA